MRVEQLENVSHLSFERSVSWIEHLHVDVDVAVDDDDDDDDDDVDVVLVFFGGGNKLLFANGFEKIMLVLEQNSSWWTPRMSNSDKKSARLLKFHGPPTKKWSCDIWFTLSVIHVDETTVSKLVWILLISSLFLLGLCSDPSTGCDNQEVVGASQLLVHCAHVHLVCLHGVILFSKKNTWKKESLSMFCAKSVVNIERIQHHRAVGFELIWRVHVVLFSLKSIRGPRCLLRAIF